MPRAQPDAVLHEAEMLAQVSQLVTQGTVTTTSGKALQLSADTLCVHGDNQAAIAQVEKIKALLA